MSDGLIPPYPYGPSSEARQGSSPPPTVGPLTSDQEELLKKLTGKPDMVNHPPHYTTHPSGIECIEVTRWMNFNLGNVIKYLWRTGSKGDSLEQLQKAAWYLNDEIARVQRMQP